MPTDPRKAVGSCAQQGVSGKDFDGTYSAWATGGSGAGTIAAAWTQSYGEWPPASIANGGEAAQLPMYTATGSVVTLPPPTLTASATKSVDLGNGWYDSSDTAGGITVIPGCSYPNAWSAVGAAIPTGCGGSKAAVAARSIVTPPPVARR